MVDFMCVYIKYVHKYQTLNLTVGKCFHYLDYEVPIGHRYWSSFVAGIFQDSLNDLFKLNGPNSFQ